MKTMIIVLSLSFSCVAQGVHVPTVTRTVQQFGELERKLASADPTAKAQFLADDFEERLCSEPGTPIPRQDWLQKVAASNARFSQESVHVLGDVALYSALRTEEKSSQMIVDTWKQADGGWKLAVRYRCPASGSKPAQSGPPKRY
jgi:hypothetical protein